MPNIQPAGAFHLPTHYGIYIALLQLLIKVGLFNSVPIAMSVFNSTAAVFSILPWQWEVSI